MVYLNLGPTVCFNILVCLHKHFWSSLLDYSHKTGCTVYSLNLEDNFPTVQVLVFDTYMLRLSS